MAFDFSVWKINAAGERTLARWVEILGGIFALVIIILLLYPIFNKKNNNSNAEQSSAQNTPAEIDPARLLQKSELDALRAGATTTASSIAEQKAALDKQRKTVPKSVQNTAQQKTELDALLRSQN